MEEYGIKVRVFESLLSHSSRSMKNIKHIVLLSSLVDNSNIDSMNKFTGDFLLLREASMPCHCRFHIISIQENFPEYRNDVAGILRSKCTIELQKVASPGLGLPTA